MLCDPLVGRLDTIFGQVTEILLTEYSKCQMPRRLPGMDEIPVKIITQQVKSQ